MQIRETAERDREGQDRQAAPDERHEAVAEPVAEEPVEEEAGERQDDDQRKEVGVTGYPLRSA